MHQQYDFGVCCSAAALLCESRYGAVFHECKLACRVCLLVLYASICIVVFLYTFFQQSATALSHKRCHVDEFSADIGNCRHGCVVRSRQCTCTERPQRRHQPEEKGSGGASCEVGAAGVACSGLFGQCKVHAIGASRFLQVSSWKCDD